MTPTTAEEVLLEANREAWSSQQMVDVLIQDGPQSIVDYMPEYLEEVQAVMDEGGQVSDMVSHRPVVFDDITDMEAELGLIETALAAASLAILEAEKAIVVAQTIQYWTPQEQELFQIYRVEEVSVSYVVSEVSGSEQVAATCYTAGVPYGCLKTVDIYSDVTKWRTEENVIIEDKWFYPPVELDTARMLLYAQEQTAIQLSVINTQRAIIAELNTRFKSILTQNAYEEHRRFYDMAEAISQKFEMIIVSVTQIAYNIQQVLESDLNTVLNLLDANDGKTTSSIEIMQALSEKLEIFKNYGNAIETSIVDGNVVLVNSMDNHLAGEKIKVENALEIFRVNSNQSVSNDVKMRSSLIQSSVDVFRNQTSSAAALSRVLMGGEATFDTHNNYKNMTDTAAKQNLIADGLPLGFLFGAGVKQAYKFYKKTKVKK